MFWYLHNLVVANILYPEQYIGSLAYGIGAPNVVCKHISPVKKPFQEVIDVIK